MSPQPKQTTPVRFIRKDEDVADAPRVTIGNLKDQVGIYVVFRGEPADAVAVLTSALAEAKTNLLTGKYEDRRGQLRVG